MARRARGEVKELSPGRWLVRVFAGYNAAGRRAYTSKVVHGNKTDAEKKRTDLLAKRDTGGLVVTPKTTLGEWLTAWLANVVKPSCRARTHADYTGVVERYVRPHLGTVPLKQIAPDGIRAWLMKLRERGLSARTVRMAHEVLRNALEAAVSDRLIAENYARARLVKKALPAKARRDVVTIRSQDAVAFCDVAEDHRLGALWTLMLFGGLRPSEALALRWADVAGNTVSVRRVLVDKAGLELQYAPPKSAKSRRGVVVPDIVIRSLRAHRARQAAEQLAAGPAWQDTEGLIFTTETGGLLRQDTARDAFRDILEAAGLPTMRPYDLRHSAATLLLEQGVPLKVVSERLGHSTITLTADTYSHVSRGMQEQAAAALDKLVSGQ